MARRAAHPPADTPLVPILVAFVGIAIFSVMDAVMKHLSIAIGAYNAMLWRTMVSLLLLGPLWLMRGGRWPRGDVLTLHVVRGLSLGISLLLFFWALARVPMALGIALTFISPLIALGMAALFLGERVGRSAVTASIIALAGVIIILIGQPRGNAALPDWQAPAAILVAAIFYAVGTVIGRPLAQRASPLDVALFFNVFAGALFLGGAPWFAILPDAGQWPGILFAALASNASIMLLAWAYARAEAQYLLPVDYTAFMWGSLLGWLVFAEPLSPATVGGAVLIVGGCLWSAQRARPARAKAS